MALKRPLVLQLALPLIVIAVVGALVVTRERDTRRRGSGSGGPVRESDSGGVGSGASAGASEDAGFVRIRVRFEPPLPGLVPPPLVLRRGRELRFGKVTERAVLFPSARLAGGPWQVELVRSPERDPVGGGLRLRADSRHPLYRVLQAPQAIDPSGARQYELTLGLIAKPVKVEVTVLDDKGPVAGADLFFEPDPPFPEVQRTPAAHTDASGRAVLTVPGCERLILIAGRKQPAGLAEARLTRPFPSALSLTLDDPRAAMRDPDAFHFAPKVTDSAGRPVRRARTHLRLIEEDPGQAAGDAPLRELLVAEQPELHFQGRAGRYEARIETAHEVATVELRLDRPGQVERPEIQLAPKPRATGVLLKPDGSPAVGAVIDTTAEDGRLFQPEGPGLFKVDSEGRFAVPIDEGDRLLRAWLPGHVALRLALEPRPDNVTLTLEPAVTLTGRLLDAGGRPCSGLDIELEGLDRHARTLSAGDGAFAFDGLPDGRYTLLVSSGPETAAVRLIDRPRQDLGDIRLPAGHDLPFRIEGRFEQLSDLDITVLPIALEGTPGPHMAWVAEPIQRIVDRPALRLRGLPPGRHLLRLRGFRRELGAGEGGSMVLATAIVTRPGPELRLRPVAPGRIQLNFPADRRERGLTFELQPAGLGALPPGFDRIRLRDVLGLPDLDGWSTRDGRLVEELAPGDWQILWSYEDAPESRQVLDFEVREGALTTVRLGQ